MQKVVNLHKNYISSIFGHFWVMYINNGSHFVNDLMKNYYKNCGIIHYIELISHPSSIMLFEKEI